jgi:hypothetical protein
MVSTVLIDFGHLCGNFALSRNINGFNSFPSKETKLLEHGTWFLLHGAPQALAEYAEISQAH